MTSSVALLSAITAPGSKINEDAYGLWPMATAARERAIPDEPRAASS